VTSRAKCLIRRVSGLRDVSQFQHYRRRISWGCHGNCAGEQLRAPGSSRSLGTRVAWFGSKGTVRLTRNKLVGPAALSVALLAIGAAASVRFWTPATLSLPRKVIRPPQPSELFADHGPHDIPCPTVPQQAAPSEPIETSVCRVVQHPDEFLCKRIRVRATHFHGLHAWLGAHRRGMRCVREPEHRQVGCLPTLSFVR